VQCCLLLLVCFCQILVLTSEGKVLQLGGASYIMPSPPSDTSSGVTAIAAGYGYSLAVKGGKVLMWRSALTRQAGWVDQQALCGAKPPTTTTAVAVAAGVSHALVLLKDGSTLGFGCDMGGVLTEAPTASKSGIAAIAAGEEGSLVYSSASKKLVAWGSSQSSLTALNDVAVPSGGLASLSASSSHGLALIKADGTLRMSDKALAPPVGSVKGRLLRASAGWRYTLGVDSAN
jgi:hypothetical protein